MKKIVKRLMFLSIIMIAVTLSAIKLYSTYATGETQTPDETFTFNLTDGAVVIMPRYSVKIVYYQTTNNNPGTVRYGLGYSTTNNDVIVKAYADNTDNYTGLIDEGVTKTFRLRIENYSNEDTTVELKTILGYENGGNLIVPEGTTLINSTSTGDPMIEEANNSNEFYGISRSTIESIEYTTLSNMPNDAVTTDISSSNDNSIRLWTSDNNGNELLEVHIGTLSGKLKGPSGVIGMKNMFSNLKKVSFLDLSMFDTSDVTKMDYLFYYDSILESVNLSSFNTSNVTTMSQMFRGCNKLNNLNIKNFNTSSVTDMSYMFNDCKALTAINLNSFNTSNVKYMQYMFASSNQLLRLNLDNFDTSSVLQMNYMFHGLTRLSKLYISNFTFGGVNNYTGMFNNVPTTADIVVKDCTQYNLLTTGTGRTAGIRTITNMSTACTSS